MSDVSRSSSRLDRIPSSRQRQRNFEVVVAITCAYRQACVVEGRSCEEEVYETLFANFDDREQ